MKVKINGAESEILDNITVLDLAKLQEIGHTGTAIAINDKLVRRAEWQSTYLQEGDDIVIIQAAYGG